MPNPTSHQVRGVTDDAPADITIPFDDGETIVRALGEYRDAQAQDSLLPSISNAERNAFREAAQNTQRIIDCIEAQL